jgi:hypothetical protein
MAFYYRRRRRLWHLSPLALPTGRPSGLQHHGCSRALIRVRASEKASVGPPWPWGREGLPAASHLSKRQHLHLFSWSFQETTLANNYAASYLNAPCFLLSCDRVTKFIVRSLFFVKRRRRRRWYVSLSFFMLRTFWILSSVSLSLSLSVSDLQSLLFPSAYLLPLNDLKFSLCSDLLLLLFFRSLPGRGVRSGRILSLRSWIIFLYSRSVYNIWGNESVASCDYCSDFELRFCED